MTTEPSIRAQIIAHHGSRLLLQTDSGERAQIKTPLDQKWAVGDRVTLNENQTITALERKRALTYLDKNQNERILASNLDILLIVTACGALFRPALLDRFIVAADAAEIRPHILINKTDLASPDESGLDEIERARRRYENVGIGITALNALAKIGIDKVSSIIGDKIGALVGHSGVGKTTIFNALTQSEIQRATAPINPKTSKGRHKTTSTLMLKTVGGGALIDSPGIRSFSPNLIESATLARHFPGFAPYLDQCRYADCAHISEPGCAIKEAVARGKITPESIASYERLYGGITPTRR